MPNNLIKKLSREDHISKGKLEHVYKDVENNARKEGARNPYAVATAVVEKYAHAHKHHLNEHHSKK